MLIQILVTVIVILFVLPSILSSYRKKSLTTFGAVLSVIFWLIVLLIIWFPEIIGLIGNTLGVARSIDALIYLSIIYLLYVSFSQRIKINEVKKEITLLNRKLALKELKNHEKEK